jgi:hypothetical protein
MSDKFPKFFPGTQAQEPVGQQPNVYIYVEYKDHVHPADYLIFDSSVTTSAVCGAKKAPALDPKNPQLPHAIAIEEGERHTFGWVMVAGSLGAQRAAFQARAAQTIAVPGQAAPKGRMPGVMTQTRTVKL